MIYDNKVTFQTNSIFNPSLGAVLELQFRQLWIQKTKQTQTAIFSSVPNTVTHLFWNFSYNGNWNKIYTTSETIASLAKARLMLSRAAFENFQNEIRKFRNFSELSLTRLRGTFNCTLEPFESSSSKHIQRSLIFSIWIQIKGYTKFYPRNGQIARMAR